MLKLTTVILAVHILIIGMIPADTCQASEIIRINGSGNALDMMKPLIAAYIKTNRNIRIEMEKPLGSTGATKALLTGALDLAVTSRNIKPEETTKGARQLKYGKTPVVIVTEKNVHKSGISTKELEDIFTGKKIYWENGEKIRLVLRPNEDIDTNILRALSDGINKAIDAAHARPGMIMAITDPESYSTIAKTPGSIGTTSLNSIISEKLPLNILSFNGIKPSLKAISNGSYPLAKEINFVTTTKTTPETKRLINYIFSPQGRAIAEKAGVLVTASPTEGK